MRYFSTFASGFEDLAARFLAADLPDAAIVKKMDGALVYETAAAKEKIRDIGYFKNSFAVLQEFQDSDLSDMAARARVHDLRLPSAARSFALALSDENEFVAIDGGIKARLVGMISDRTGLSYRQTAADVELWLLRRSGGDGFFMRRITKNCHAPAPGELEPHVAMLLVRAGRPAAEDVFLDPFCGHGAIPLARARAGGYRGIFAFDNNAAVARAFRSRIRALKNSRIRKSFFVKPADFFDNGLHGNSIDAVVTDPPWGLHQRIGADFYARMMGEFGRIMRAGGRLVILTARGTALPAHDRIAPVELFNVLIHGQKATVHILSCKD